MLDLTKVTMPFKSHVVYILHVMQFKCTASCFVMNPNASSPTLLVKTELLTKNEPEKATVM